MVPFAYRTFRQTARDALSCAKASHRSLTALHTGITLAAALAITAVRYILQLGIAGTGGLDGIGLRSFLEFTQSMLQLAGLVLLPFWTMGYVFCALQLSRRQSVSRRCLLTGFRHFAAVLRTVLLRSFVCVGTAIVGGQLGSTVFLITPAAQKLLQLTQELSESGITDTAALMANPAYRAAVLPMLPFIAVGALVPSLPIFYRTRFMRHMIMDQPDRGAFYAMVRSIQMTRRRFWALVVLDLRLWWYYVPVLLALAVRFGPVLLPLLGVPLPLQPGAALFLFCGASLLCQLTLAVWKKADVAVTYALIFDHIRDNPVPMAPNVPRKSKQVPWNY